MLGSYEKNTIERMKTWISLMVRLELNLYMRTLTYLQKPQECLWNLTCILIKLLYKRILYQPYRNWLQLLMLILALYQIQECRRPQEWNPHITLCMSQAHTKMMKKISAVSWYIK